MAKPLATPTQKSGRERHELIYLSIYHFENALVDNIRLKYRAVIRQAFWGGLHVKEDIDQYVAVAAGPDAAFSFNLRLNRQQSIPQVKTRNRKRTGNREQEKVPGTVSGLCVRLLRPQKSPK